MNITTISGSLGGISSYDEDTDYELALNPGTERIDFEIDAIEPSEKLISFSSENTSYEFPISIFVDEQSEQGKLYSFKIEPSELDITMNITAERKKLVYIYNTGTGTLTDIELRLSDSLKPYVRISEDKFGRILTNDNAHINMTILSSGEDGKTISGDLIVETEQGLSNSMRVIVTTEKGYIPSEEELAPELATDETCSDTGGRICSETEECNSKTFPAKDGICCPGGDCKTKPGESSLGKVFGWLILVVIIVGGVWFFFKKYRKVKKPVDLLEVAKGKK
jgi:preprotein translocase subunit YajC